MCATVRAETSSSRGAQARFARHCARETAPSSRAIAELRAVDDDSLVFAHGPVLRVLAACRLGLEPAAGRLFALDAATIIVLGYERETSVARRWNAEREDLS
jgi:broad specificity phosphatase PhoE